MAAQHHQRTVRPTLDMVTARVLTPAWLFFLLGLQISDGTTNALPIWIRNLAVQAGAEPEMVLRGLIVAEIVFAGTMLLVPRIARGVALATLLVLCFSAIASIAAAPGDRGAALVHAVILLVAGMLLLGLRRQEPRPTMPAPLLSLSPAWRVVGMVAVVTVAGAVGGRIAIKVPTVPVGASTAPIFRFELDAWLQMPVAQIPLREHLPMLTARTVEGERYVVFYTSTCGSCHELFERRFADRLSVPVIAVRVPPPPDVPVAPGDQLGDVNCPECEFMQLRPGPLYLVQTPVVMVVSDGVIRCIADATDPEACFFD